MQGVWYGTVSVLVVDMVEYVMRMIGMVLQTVDMDVTRLATTEVEVITEVEVFVEVTRDGISEGLHD